MLHPLNMADMTEMDDPHYQQLVHSFALSALFEVLLRTRSFMLT